MKYNLNETTDQFIAGCVMTPPIKEATGAYREPGLPTPPAGWGKVLPTDEEAMESMYPDLYDVD